MKTKGEEDQKREDGGGTRRGAAEKDIEEVGEVKEEEKDGDKEGEGWRKELEGLSKVEASWGGGG